ncbi:MAG: lysophospholipid acyltransferase family protein [Acidobacteriota bacterium]
MGKKSKFQIKSEYYAFRVAMGALSVMPRPLALAVCRTLSHAAFHSLSGPRRTGMRNLELAFPDMPAAERQMIIRGTFENLGRVVAEMSQLHKATPANFEKIVDFEMDEESRAVYAQNRHGRGVLIITGHFGNWEMMAAAFALLHKPQAFLARPLDNPLIDEMTAAIRTRYGNRQIDKTHSAMTAIKILRGGGLLGILADVNAHPKEGVFVPFFGVEACTPSGAAMIALRSDALMFPTFCIWDKAAGRYRMIHGRALEPVRTGDRKRDVVETTAAYTAEIERIIRQNPDQWMWIHKRWKTRPPGEAKVYD